MMLPPGSMAVVGRRPRTPGRIRHPLTTTTVVTNLEPGEEGRATAPVPRPTAAAPCHPVAGKPAPVRR